MRYGKGFALVLLVVLCTGCGLWAQQKEESKKTREQLEKERHRLEEDVKLTRRLILQTKSTQKKSLAELQLLESQIRLGERLQSSIQTEVKSIDREIETLSEVTTAMAADVRKLQVSFGHAAYITYKKQNNLSALLWLFSSESFEQAYNRLKYFREFSRYRKQQIFLIKRAQTYLGEKLSEISGKRDKKQQLAESKKQEADRLTRAKKDKNQLVGQLATRESSYHQQLVAYKGSLEAIQREIDKVIREEIEKARLATAKVRTANAAKADVEVVSLGKLSTQFEKNRGKLPWPVSQNKGVITGQFGRQEDASGGVLQNDGVYIGTEKDAPVRAVFSGTVTHVRNNKLIGTVVIVQHGKYRTVYVNFKDVKVKEGQQIATLDEIGTVGANTRTGATELHFLIYNERTPIDPQLWIARK